MSCAAAPAGICSLRIAVITPRATASGWCGDESAHPLARRRCAPAWRLLRGGRCGAVAPRSTRSAREGRLAAWSAAWAHSGLRSPKTARSSRSSAATRRARASGSSTATGPASARSSPAREPIASWLTSHLSGLPPVTPLPTRRSKPGPAGREHVATTHVVIADVRDGRTRESFAGEGLHWYAKGRRMVWVCDSEPDPYGERESICFTRAGGGAVQQIEVGLVDRVAPAPDGVRIAFTGLGGSPLGVVNLRTRSVRVLVDPASSVDGAPTWSPDSRRIAYATAAGELFTIRTSGGRPRRVGRFANARSPAWSPGGGRIAFLRERLWTVHPDGKGARRITRERLSAADCPVSSSTAPSCGPAWSPGSRKLYYLGRR